ncbi:NAD-dependent succinate-semialdehyde dehydrogenase [Aspergillus tanneri]|uniref:Succinate-semialdehyde dehydrogenase, mitochondrial n=1 Tax=Aspergillus tanneri TaxID=1220188 RepID=A0A5M9N527_9EURO|nr:Succinate-semialdehyde dehydrogenase, mitochondrial [Aspergillus tanneri]KAA8652810.1 Succinate-semialdehyde dehydrogenase, mitochondrial [Aspergillus tanneri]
MNLQDKSLLRGVELIQGGRETSLCPGQFFEVTDPATSRPIALVPDLDAEQCIEAVTTAVKAAEEVKKLTAKARSEMLQKWCTLTREAEEDLSRIITAENGKPLVEAKAEIAYASEFIHWFSGEAQRLDGSKVTASSVSSHRVITLKQPVGVVGIVTPWNFPAAMVTRKVAAAIAAGCTCVLKPAEETPMTALAMAELANRAGLPAGAFSVVTTATHRVEVGKVLTQHPDIRKFSFTGSTAVGKLLAAQCATTVKRVSLELGGNAAFVIFDDANLEKAVEGIMQSKFRLSGQTCVCANRVYIQSGIHDRLVQALVQRVKCFQLGPGDDPNTTLGPLINSRAADKVAVHVEDARARGAQILFGGQRAEGLGRAFFEPTVAINVHPDSLCAQEETFGPLVPIIKFDSEEDAIQMTNSSSVGLSGYLFTESLSRAWRVAEAMEVGMVGVNTGRISDVAVPFGGVKESGLGREGASVGVNEYLEIKSVTLDIGS